jgi:hypothetical protein
MMQLVRKCVICGAEISHKHWSAKVCSALCASERDQRYREERRDKIAEQMREYRAGKRDEIASRRLKRFSDPDRL